MQTTACIAKGNYISAASVCPEVSDSQSKPRQALPILYPLSEINRTVPGLIHDLSLWNIHCVALHSLDASDVHLDLTALLRHHTSPEPFWVRHLSSSAQHRGNSTERIEDSDRYKISICLPLACRHGPLWISCQRTLTMDPQSKAASQHFLFN